ncbi:hypothetical protein QOZ80_7BG0588220 [Eleusine coracana subsp. coracana]|nr:hypothetical protein QOZ80_7BG0588220 [Eleusine coracana subsp. coracana]
MAFPDGTLRRIFERIDSPVSLLRAAATCKRWHIIASPTFLRRYRSAHPARAFVAGAYFNDSTLLSSLMPPIRSVAHSSSSSLVDAKQARDRPSFVPASPSVDARKFSLDFLPDDSDDAAWTVFDSHGSLLLHNRTRIGLSSAAAAVFPDMFVCEPATRQYKRIPRPPPKFLSKSINNIDNSYTDAYLIEGGNGTADCIISMSNFKVLCVFHGVFSHYTVTFTAGATTDSWRSSAPPTPTKISWPSYAKASASMPTSYPATRSLSSGHWAAREAHVFKRVEDGDWALDKSVVLPEATRGLPGYKPEFFESPMNILTRGPGFVVLSPQVVERWLVSVDLETMEVSPAEEEMGVMVYGCALPWPPALNASV